MCVGGGVGGGGVCEVCACVCVRVGEGEREKEKTERQRRRERKRERERERGGETPATFFKLNHNPSHSFLHMHERAHDALPTSIVCFSSCLLPSGAGHIQR